MIMIKQRLSIVVLSALALLSVSSLYFLLNLFSPSNAGPIGVLAVFATVYIFSFSALSLIARMLENVYRAVRPQHPIAPAQQDRRQVYQKRVNLIAAVLSLVPIFLISLNSIGELGLADVALIVAIEGLLIFYIFKKV